MPESGSYEDLVGMVKFRKHLGIDEDIGGLLRLGQQVLCDRRKVGRRLGCRVMECVAYLDWVRSAFIGCSARNFCVKTVCAVLDDVKEFLQEGDLSVVGFIFDVVGKIPTNLAVIVALYGMKEFMKQSVDVVRDGANKFRYFLHLRDQMLLVDLNNSMYQLEYVTGCTDDCCFITQCDVKWREIVGMLNIENLTDILKTTIAEPSVRAHNVWYKSIPRLQTVVKEETYKEARFIITEREYLCRLDERALILKDRQSDSARDYWAYSKKARIYVYEQLLDIF